MISHATRFSATPGSSTTPASLPEELLPEEEDDPLDPSPSYDSSDEPAAAIFHSMIFYDGRRTSGTLGIYVTRNIRNKMYFYPILWK
jgi:hypothetical protein